MFVDSFGSLRVLSPVLTQRLTLSFPSPCNTSIRILRAQRPDNGVYYRLGVRSYVELPELLKSVDLEVPQVCPLA